MSSKEWIKPKAMLCFYQSGGGIFIKVGVGFKIKPIPCMKITLSANSSLIQGILVSIKLTVGLCFGLCFSYRYWSAVLSNFPTLSWSRSLYRWFSISVVCGPSVYLWRKPDYSQINSLCLLYLDNKRFLLASISEEVSTLRDLARLVKHKNKIFYSNKMFFWSVAEHKTRSHYISPQRPFFSGVMVYASGPQCTT